MNTDTPAGVAADPRPVLMMGDEPDTVADLMRLADGYACVAYAARSAEAAKRSTSRRELQDAIRAALNGDAA